MGFSGYTTVMGKWKSDCERNILAIKSGCKILAYRILILSSGLNIEKHDMLMNYPRNLSTFVRMDQRDEGVQ